VLEVDRVSRRFGEVVALDELTFTVPAGSVCGFCGPNGAGKTTAMRILVGILAADAGEIRWHGDPVDRELCRRFGYLPEERGLYPAMHVRDHLVYVARLRGLALDRARRASDRMLERLHITALASRRVDSLSLGNQQRVQLATALVHQPTLVVLDEPFNGLDPLAVDELAALLAESATNGTTVLLSSHQLDMVERVCDRAVIIARGRTLTSGSIAEMVDVAGARRPLHAIFADAVNRDPDAMGVGS